MMHRHRFRRRFAARRSGRSMQSAGVRGKLNQLYIAGSFVFAGYFGLAYHSWIVFGVVFGAACFLNLIGGNIRVAGSR